MKISFQSEHEARFMLGFLNEQQKKNDFHASLLNETMIHCQSKHWDSFINDVLIPGFIHFFMNIKESHIILSIIEKQFYFVDQDEQQQILHIAQSIMEGERSEIPEVKHFPPREQLLISALKNFLHPDQSFTVESFIQFRLSDYMTRLTEYVGISIEEYKMEQEYQNFIESLRDYVISNEPKLSVLHLLHDDGFQIFNEQFIEMKKPELKRWLDREFIFQHPMYIDSQLLAPLVSIAPLKVYIYSDDQEEGMILTIQNIFQERVRLLPKSSFAEQMVSMAHLDFEQKSVYNTNKR